MSNATATTSPRAETLCFAYGSNLDERQMRARCPSARIVGCAQLSDHALAFSGRSVRWRGAVATVIPCQGARVAGLLYGLEPADLWRLDAFEGCPFSYWRVRRWVWSASGRRRNAAVYLQAPDAPLRPPAERYLEVLARAYARHGFALADLEQAVRRSSAHHATRAKR